MNRWKLLCGAEACALILAWWWLGRAPEAAEAQFNGAEQPTSASLVPSATANSTPLPAPPSEAKQAEEPPNPPSSPNPSVPRTDGRVTLMGSVVDGQGAPILEPWVQIYHENADIEQVRVVNGQSTFLLLDRLPGDYEMEIQATGFVALRGPVRLRPAPSIQRQTFRLQRAWRVLVRVETDKGERLVEWLARTTAGNAREYRPLFAALRDPPSGNLFARESPPFRSELGAFVGAGISLAGIPAGWDGALDVAVEPPLHAAAWLGSLLLGSAPLRAGEDRLIIQVNQQELAARLSVVSLKVVDAISGAPLPAAKVSLTPQWMSSGGRPVDATGRIRFENLVPGTMDLEIFCQGYGETYRDLTLRPGQLHDLGDVGLTAVGIIRGLVLDPQGNPCPQFPFMLFPTGGWQGLEDPQRSHSSTDAEGRFASITSAERHQLILGGGQYGLQAAVWERGSAEVDEREIRLLPGVAVRLLLQAPENQARLLWLMDAAGLLLARSHPSQYGDWNLSLTPGTYLLRVEDLDRNLLGTLDLRVPEGGGDLEIALP